MEQSREIERKRFIAWVRNATAARQAVSKLLASQGKVRATARQHAQRDTQYDVRTASLPLTLVDGHVIAPIRVL
jgi:hypothetical protein